jgi:hypothetical protein
LKRGMTKLRRAKAMLFARLRRSVEETRKVASGSGGLGQLFMVKLNEGTEGAEIRA